ncbi:MAG: hypothetical protein JO170_24105 [Verrucomicrobia bacterium]|nr:hypothetical protein [Verrucomicrobiota bacterium]
MPKKNPKDSIAEGKVSHKTKEGTKYCHNCGAHNDDQAQRCAVCNKWLESVKKPNLRNGSKPKFTNSGRREGLRNFQKDVITWPLKTDDGQAIWTGTREELGGFPDKFLLQFLADYYAQKNGLNEKKLTTQTKNGITKYQCISCLKFFPRKTESDNVNWISIDHRTPIREYVIEKAKLHINEIVGGHYWSFYLLQECKAAHLTPKNLDPMCQSCNSHAGGNKDLDGEMRVHQDNNCIHEMCRKARDKTGPSTRSSKTS